MEPDRHPRMHGRRVFLVPFEQIARHRDDRSYLSDVNRRRHEAEPTQDAGFLQFKRETQMNTESWFLLIYQTATAESQATLAETLRTLGSLTVATEHNNGDYFVILECPGTVPALTIHELVVTIDASADLIDTHTGSPDVEIHLLSKSIRQNISMLRLGKAPSDDDLISS